MNSVSLEDRTNDGNCYNEGQTMSSKRIQSSSDHTATTSVAYYEEYVQYLTGEEDEQDSHDALNDISDNIHTFEDKGNSSSDSLVLENLRLVVKNDKRSSYIKSRSKQLNKDEADDCFEALEDFEDDSDEEDSLVVTFKRQSMEYVTRRRARSVSRLYEATKQQFLFTLNPEPLTE
jgi:hypothetical protein